MARGNARKLLTHHKLPPKMPCSNSQQYTLQDINRHLESLKPPSARIVLTNGAIELNGDEFKTLTSPRIFLWIRGVELLYVGYSDSSFAGFRRREEVLSSDTVAVFFISDLKELRRMVRNLIDAYRPRYNRTIEQEGELKPIEHGEVLDVLMEKLKK